MTCTRDVDLEKTLGVQENNSSQNCYLKYKLFCSLSSWSGASRLVGLNYSSFEFQMRLFPAHEFDPAQMVFTGLNS